MGSSQGCSSLSRMGGQQERICPLCMEEMDLTDQELQPCICGYEICLWCWHFIIQTAAKDGSDARCPACHSTYDMEKILKRTISKERLEIVNAHKKHKLQKTKRKLTDLGKDLNSIRVIRRNIVYIAGIPKKISNEKTLRKKEYLGQYGKIVKICFAQTDVSRQYYSSDSCIVYATFSMEEEALRCIQVVNGYILDGRPLKASFGTTRYCYSWLNNLPCKNPDCLYVHDVVPQEDICSREEVISFCTSKLQQCSGLTYTNLGQHSGSFFPPPLNAQNLPAPLDLINSNRYMQCDYFGRSYATVASSHNQSKLFNMNDNLVRPSSRAEVYFSSSIGDHNHVGSSVPTSSNEMPIAKHGMENFSRSKLSVGSCHSKNTFWPDYKTAVEINQVAEDNICMSSFIDNHISERIIGESFLSHLDGNSQLPSSSTNVTTHASAGSFNCLTNIGKWESESLGSIAKRFSLKWDDLSTISRKCDPFFSLQMLPGDSTSAQQNTLTSYDCSKLHSNLRSAKFSCSFEDESITSPFSKKSKDFSSFSSITSNLCSSSSSNNGPDFEFSHTGKTRDKKSLNQLHSDLGFAKFNYSLEDESLSISFGKKSNDFSTFSTLDTNLYHELDKPLVLLPTEPMAFHGEQKNSCNRILSNSCRNFEATLADKTRDEKFLIESYTEDCEDRILSNIFALNLDAIDDSGDTHSILEQLGCSNDLSIMSNSSLPFRRDGSKCYFSVMDDMYVAIGQLSSWSNGASGLTNNSSCSEFMVKKEAYMEDLFNKIYLETSKTSKVLNNTSLLPASMLVSNSINSLDMQHSGSSLSQPMSQHPCSNSTRRTTLSTPPGFPPRKTNPGGTAQSQPHSTDSAKITSSSTEILPSSIASVNTCENPHSSQRLLFPHFSDHEESWKDQFNSVSSNAIDFSVIDRNHPSLASISSVSPELQNRHLASYF